MDNGRPIQLSSTTRVVVRIDDDNDEAPQFTERLYSVLIPASPASSHPVDLYQVVAADPDVGENAHITYSIMTKNNDRFIIDPNSGMISSQKEFIEGSQYDITVSIQVYDI